MKFKKIEFARQGNFVLALLLIHFVFFGYICNYFEKDITGEQILYLHRILFNPQTFISLIILFAIVFYVGFREQFFEYGLRNSIWLIPGIIIMSWIWYWFINQEFDPTIIGTYWLHIESYITILTLLGVNLLAAITGLSAKETYKRYLKRIKEFNL